MYLLALVKNPTRILSKDELINMVWTDTTVEDNSVERAVVNIRKALNDTASNPKYIRIVLGPGSWVAAHMRC